MTFLSKFERASAELRKVPVRCPEDGLTPGHTAASAALGGGDDERDDERDEERKPEAAKAYRDAYIPPAEYPEPIAVCAEDFRHGPVRAGHAAPDPGECA